MKYYLRIIVIMSLIAGCKKDNYLTSPKITIKSITPSEVKQGGTLTTILQFTDKEGDVGGGELIIIRNRLNRRPLPTNNIKTDTIRNTVPDFPSKSLGEMNVVLEYNNFLKESPIENDTIILKFAVRDVKGNKSDTITTRKIIIVK